MFAKLTTLEDGNDIPIEKREDLVAGQSTREERTTERRTWSVQLGTIQCMDVKKVRGQRNNPMKKTGGNTVWSSQGDGNVTSFHKPDWKTW